MLVFSIYKYGVMDGVTIAAYDQIQLTSLIAVRRDQSFSIVETTLIHIVSISNLVSSVHISKVYMWYSV